MWLSGSVASRSPFMSQSMERGVPKVSEKLSEDQDDLPGFPGAGGCMPEITAESIGHMMRDAVAELGTPTEHRGVLSAKAMLRNAAAALGWPPRRVRAYWHGEVPNPPAVEFLQAQARLNAHRKQIEARRAKADANRAAYEVARRRFIETHPALGRLAPPSVDDAEGSSEA